MLYCNNTPLRMRLITLQACAHVTRNSYNTSAYACVLSDSKNDSSLPGVNTGDGQLLFSTDNSWRYVSLLQH